MPDLTIYHNPKCSKSRNALAMLQANHLNPIVIEYLKTPLSLEHITQLQTLFNLNEFVRITDPLFHDLNLTLNDKMGVLNAIVKQPILMQRPIIRFQEQAIIAREPEKTLAFITVIKKKSGLFF